MQPKVMMSEVPLGEMPADRAKRVAGTEHGEILAERDPEDSATRLLMAPSVPIAHGGGTKRRSRTKQKHGTKICPTCDIELSACQHRPKRGRPPNTQPTQPAKVSLPDPFTDFLKRSKLKLGDVLAAVLDSKAVNCWRKHVPETTASWKVVYVEDDGVERAEPRTPYHIELERRQRTYRHFNDDEPADFLKRLKPTLASKRCDQLVPKALIERAELLGQSNKDGAYRSRYSRTRFVSWAIWYFADCVAEIRGLTVNSSERRRAVNAVTSSRTELADVKEVATKCFWCEANSIRESNDGVNARRGTTVTEFSGNTRKVWEAFMPPAQRFSGKVSGLGSLDERRDRR